MAFDGFVTRKVAFELNSCLSGGRIEKIYHPSRQDLVFIVSNKKEKFKVFMSADSSHFGIYLTEEKFENPKTPSSFNMLLRKHIEGSKIKKICQVGWERIIEIIIDARDEMGYSNEKKLIVEIMNKQSNIILVESSTNKILDALKRTSFDTNNLRQLLPSMVYEYPPLQDKITPEEFLELDECQISLLKDFKSYLDLILGISPVVALNLSLSTSPKRLMQEYLSNLTNTKILPKVYFEDRTVPKDFHFLNLDTLCSLEYNSFSSMSKAINFYYTNRLESNRLKQKASEIEKKLKSLMKKLNTKKRRLLDDIKSAENSNIYQLYGELITANLHNIKGKPSSVELLNYYDDGMIKINLDTKLTPIENAQIFFKKYNKSKRALVEKDLQMELTDRELIYLKTTLDFLQMAESSKEIDEIKEELIETGYIRDKKFQESKKLKKKVFTTYKSPSGFTIYVGKNNKENDYLSTKFANKSDLWFHTKDISSSHVVLSLQGEKPKNEDIIFTSQITAYYSKARHSENVPVDYTFIKFVKKPKGAKLGMVIFTDNSTVYVNPKLPTE